MANKTRKKPTIVRAKAPEPNASNAKTGRPKLGRLRLQITLSPKGKEIAFKMAAARGVTVGQLFDLLLRGK